VPLTIFGAIDATLAVVLVAFFSPLVTYLVTARKLSGKIKNSEATELWAESRSIREWSVARVKELDDHIDELELRLKEVELANSDLAKDNRELTREVFELRSTKAELKAVVVRLSANIEAKDRLIEQLHQELHDLRGGAE
jgi:chromosome segregation ATPase